MPLIDHPGGYRFLPGIAPYSCGAVSSPGHELVHVVLRRPVPWLPGMSLIDRHLSSHDRPRASLCAVELRCPTPYTFDGFASFNRTYADFLNGWDLFLDGVNPVARTNVSPAFNPPSEPSLYGFSYSRPSQSPTPPSFVVAGAGELPEGVLDAPSIIRSGETTPDALREKASFVMGLMSSRLAGLGVSWSDVTEANVYTIHPFDSFLADVLLLPSGSMSTHGVRWHVTRPPVLGIEFEMDLRGVFHEFRIP